MTPTLSLAAGQLTVSRCAVTFDTSISATGWGGLESLVAFAVPAPALRFERPSDAAARLLSVAGGPRSGVVAPDATAPPATESRSPALDADFCGVLGPASPGEPAASSV